MPRHPSKRRFLATAPLVPIAVGLVAGIVVDSTAEFSFVVTMWLLFAGAIATAWGWTGYLHAGVKDLVIAAGITLLSTAVGMLRHDLAFRYVPADHIIQVMPAEGSTLVRLAGEIVSPVQIDTLEEAARRAAYPVEPRTRFALQADTLHADAGPRAISGLVQVAIGAPHLQLAPGQRIEILGMLYRFRGPDNPGEFDWSLQKRRNGLLAGVWCDNERCVSVIDEQPTGWRTLTHRARQHLRKLLSDDLPGEDGGAASLLDAMVLAQRTSVERSVDEAFIRAGVVHFLSASGMNVVWLGMGITAVMLLFRAHYRTIALVCLLATIAFLLVAEPNPPILRAAVTGGLFFLSRWMRRPRRDINWLAGAVIILLLIRPADLFNPGFQFSFAIVAGLMWLAPPIMTRLVAEPTFIVGGVPIPVEDARRIPGWAIQWIVFPLIVAVIAWLIGLPIAAWHFGRLSLWGWINSLVLTGPVIVVTFLGYLKLAAGAIWPTLGAPIGWLLGPATNALEWLALRMSEAPLCNIETPRPSAIWIACYFVCLVVSAHALALPRYPRRLLVAAPVLALAWFAPWLLPARPTGELRLWVLSVGDGSATIIELPNGRTLAYDLGTRGPYDAARSKVVPFMQHHGLARLDDVIVSHADADHYSAIAGVAESRGIGRLWLNGGFRDAADPDSEPSRFLQEMIARGVEITDMQDGDDLPDTGAVKLEVLWPPGDVDLRSLPDNDRSTVLRLAWQGRSILLTGDIETQAQAALLGSGPKAPAAAADLRADVLLLPHHGSPRPRTTRAFIAAVNPSVTIRSSGVRDAETNPSLWSAISGRAYYNTAECGAVCVIIRQNGEVVVDTFRPSRGRPLVTLP